MSFGRVIPILRIFDEAKAQEFYVGFLGFSVDWQHRFAPELPIYIQISRDGCVLHLSEHHGDATPGAAIRIETSNLEALHASSRGRTTSTQGPGSRSSLGGGKCR
jgi:hypothetical protein